MTRIRPAGWLALAAALFLLAVTGYALLVHALPQDYWKQTDASVYRAAGLAIRRQPAGLYALRLGVGQQPFTYTPFAALLFAVASPLSFAGWQVVLAVLTIGLLPVVAYQALGIAGRPAGMARAAAAFAIAAVSLWLEPVAMTLFFGQINVVLLALVVGDLALPDRTRGKGIGIGLAAAVKLTPLIFIAYLLLTRRVRAAAVSGLTFAATIGLGFALLPHASAVYWGGQFGQPGSTPFHLLNQSLYGATCGSPTPGTMRTGTGWLRRSSSASWASERRCWPAAVATNCSAWSRAPPPACWCPRSRGRTTTSTSSPRLPSPRTARGVSATASPGPRPSSGCSASGPCPSARGRLRSPGGTASPRSAAARAEPRPQPRVHLARPGTIAGNYYVAVLLIFVAATAGAMVVACRRQPAPDEPTAAPYATPAT